MYYIMYANSSFHDRSLVSEELKSKVVDSVIIHDIHVLCLWCFVVSWQCS